MKNRNKKIIIVKRCILKYPFVFTLGKCHILCVINFLYRWNTQDDLISKIICLKDEMHAVVA